MLPNSYPSLTTPTADGLRGIYITSEPAAPYPSLDDEAVAREVPRPLACEIRQSDNPVTAVGTVPGNTGTGSIYTVNSNLATTLPPYGFNLEQLSIITSPGLALANKAFANALLQITNISRMTLPQLSAAFLAIETNKDLPLINDQSQVIPQTVIDYYKNTLASGSGDNGTILLTDIIGTTVGTNMIDNLSNCVTVLNSLYDAGELTDLITIYDDMYAALPNDAAILLLIANAQLEIANVIVANPTETTDLNTYFSGIGTQLTNEVNYQNLATLSVANVASNSQVSTQGFVFSLPSFGMDTKVGGTAQYLEDIADISTGGGQAIVATLREGRSQTGLSAAGVNNAANTVPADPATIPPQATLIPSIVSEREARSQIIY